MMLATQGGDGKKGGLLTMEQEEAAVRIVRQIDIMAAGATIEEMTRLVDGAYPALLFFLTHPAISVRIGAIRALIKISKFNIEKVQNMDLTHAYAAWQQCKDRARDAREVRQHLSEEELVFKGLLASFLGEVDEDESARKSAKPKRRRRGEVVVQISTPKTKEANSAILAGVVQLPGVVSATIEGDSVIVNTLTATLPTRGGFLGELMGIIREKGGVSAALVSVMAIRRGDTSRDEEDCEGEEEEGNSEERGVEAIYGRAKKQVASSDSDEPDPQQLLQRRVAEFDNCEDASPDNKKAPRKRKTKKKGGQPVDDIDGDADASRAADDDPASSVTTSDHERFDGQAGAAPAQAQADLEPGYLDEPMPTEGGPAAEGAPGTLGSEDEDDEDHQAASDLEPEGSPGGPAYLDDKEDAWDQVRLAPAKPRPVFQTGPMLPQASAAVGLKQHWSFFGQNHWTMGRTLQEFGDDPSIGARLAAAKRREKEAQEQNRSRLSRLTAWFSGDY